MNTIFGDICLPCIPFLGTAEHFLLPERGKREAARSIRAAEELGQRERKCGRRAKAVGWLGQWGGLGQKEGKGRGRARAAGVLGQHES